MVYVDEILINANILPLFEQSLPTDRRRNPNIVFLSELIAPVATATSGITPRGLHSCRIGEE